MLLNFKESRVLPVRSDVIEVLFPYEIEYPKGYFIENEYIKDRSLIVAISGSLAIGWGVQIYHPTIDKQKLIMVLFHFGYKHLLEKIKSRTLEVNERLGLLTSNAPIVIHESDLQLVYPDGVTYQYDIDGTASKEDLPDLSSLVTELKNLIAININDAIRTIKGILKPRSDKYDEFILHMARLNKLTDENRKGIISRDDYNVSIAKINVVMIDFINRLSIDDVQGVKNDSLEGAVAICPLFFNLIVDVFHNNIPSASH